MRFLIRIYDRCLAWTVPLQSLILLLIRLIWGFKLIFTGVDKLQNIERTSEYFQSLGIGQATNMAWTVGGIETVCGILLVVGFLSRLASLPLVAVLFGAYVTAYRPALLSIFTDFDSFTKQDPFLFLYGTLIILAFGPGKLSLDYLIRSKTGK